MVKVFWCLKYRNLFVYKWLDQKRHFLPPFSLIRSNIGHQFGSVEVDDRAVLDSGVEVFAAAIAVINGNIRKIMQPEAGLLVLGRANLGIRQ